MEKLFNILQRVIAEGMPELRLTDEDYGQLEMQEDRYPVTFPCVLLAVPEVAWTELAGGTAGRPPSSPGWPWTATTTRTTQRHRGGDRTPPTDAHTVAPAAARQETVVRVRRAGAPQEPRLQPRREA